MNKSKHTYGNKSLLGLCVTLKQLKLQSCPRLPIHQQFLPFTLVGFLDKDYARLSLRNCSETYKAKFSDLVFEDPVEATVWANVTKILRPLNN